MVERPILPKDQRAAYEIRLVIDISAVILRWSQSLQGPIIRITPHEIHIDDPDFIDQLFTGPGKRRDKDRMVGGAIQGE